MYTDLFEYTKIFNSFEWSSATRPLFGSFFKTLSLGESSLVGRLLSTISEVLPIALTVAGAILVVNLGWRLFRNFTKG